jgi:hypothetical protein
MSLHEHLLRTFAGGGGGLVYKQNNINYEI